MKVDYSSDTSVHFDQTTWRYIPAHCILYRVAVANLVWILGLSYRSLLSGRLIINVMDFIIIIIIIIIIWLTGLLAVEEACK
jgi:hypothetical protein